ncbi:MAG: LysR substrate-binding domain-containing protein [Planctomycetota bacterium]|nr:LysR substrate-binding domain-containing protein [Planctomycetota bacterium]
MDLEALRSFFHVAREHSFSRAARLMHISQPAMSVRIKMLEKSLEERLFDRARKGVVLTEAGSVLYGSAEKIFADVQEARARLKSLRDSGFGHVRLGCSDTVSLYLLPPVLRRFRKRFPEAEITIRNAYSSEIADLLVRGELDFGIVTKPPSLDRRLEARTLFTEPFCVVCPRDDPLLRRKQVTLKALDGRPMVALEKGTVTRDAIDRAFRAAGVRPKVVLETGNIEVQKCYVGIGFGIALLPRSAMADADRRRLATRPLSGTSLERDVAVVIPRERFIPRPAQALLDLLQATVGPGA